MSVRHGPWGLESMASCLTVSWLPREEVARLPACLYDVRLVSFHLITYKPVACWSILVAFSFLVLEQFEGL